MRTGQGRAPDLSARRAPIVASLGALALALPACGGDGGGRGAVTVAALGDSITAGSPLWDPNPQIRAVRIGHPVRRSQLELWAERADHALELRNCGVFGERTDQIAARLPDCADGADAVLVQGGINDIAQALAGDRAARRMAVTSAARNLDGMVVAARRMGLDVALADVLPWNNGFPVARGSIIRLNDAIARIGRRRHVPVVPFHDALEDPRRPERMRPDLTIDGDHPSISGYRRLGRLVAQAFGRRSSAGSSPRSP